MQINSDPSLFLKLLIQKIPTYFLTLLFLYRITNKTTLKMNSDLLRSIVLARNAGLLEPVQTEQQLNSSPTSRMNNLGPREYTLS